MAYKLTDAVRIYHFWVNLEDDFNDTKYIMMIAYVIGILCSAAVTVCMFDRFFKKQKEEDEDPEEAEA